MFQENDEESATSNVSTENPTQLLDDVTIMHTFMQYQIPVHLFPVIAQDRLKNGLTINEYLMDIIHTVVYDMRQISTKIPVPSVRHVVNSLCNKFPASFLAINKDGKLLTRKQLMTKFINRNNHLNRHKTKSGKH
jgi:hypothetical protein